MVARDGGGADQTQRDLAEAWESALRSAGLPLARAADARSRPRISFGAPLPVGMSADAELIDVVLTERWPAWRLREALTPVVPVGWRLVELHDVWLAGPALAGRVAAADYRVTLAGPVDGVLRERLAHACEVVLAARRLERERRKGEVTVTYDLRPLVVDVRLEPVADPVTLVARTRFHPELGTGRPEEVVAAIGEVLGESLAIETIVRERLVLADELLER